MTSKEQLYREIQDLLSSQKLAVLGTQSAEGFAYASLIAFAETDDLQSIVLATPRATRKFSNIRSNPRVSLLVDNRSNQAEDFHDAKAVTVMGVAEEVAAPGAARELARHYLKKHPYLEDFLNSPTTAFIRVRIWRYYLVKRFQEVMELHIKNENDLSAI